MICLCDTESDTDMKEGGKVEAVICLCDTDSDTDSDIKEGGEVESVIACVILIVILI